MRQQCGYTKTGLVFLENGGKGIFTVALTTQPTGKSLCDCKALTKQKQLLIIRLLRSSPNTPAGTVPAGQSLRRGIALYR